MEEEYSPCRITKIVRTRELAWWRRGGTDIVNGGEERGTFTMVRRRGMKDLFE